MRFRIRIDGEQEDLVTSFVSKYPEGIAVHHLVNNNPHYHLYIRDDMCMSAQTMRMRVKRYFTIEKATDYSVKECDNERVDEYIQYLFNTKHGNLWRRVCDIGIDSARIDCAISNAAQVSDDYDKTVKKRTKSKTVTMYDIAEELAEVMKGYHNLEAEREWYLTSSKEAIKLCKKYRKGMDYNMICKIITTYTGIVDEEKLAEKVVQYFSDKYR